MKQLKIVFIDWNRTLSYSVFFEQVKNTAPAVFEKIEKSLFVKHKDMLNPWMKGLLTAEDVIEQISRDTKLSYTLLMEALKESCEQMELCLPNLEQLIKNIQNHGIKVVIATDNMDTFRRFTIPALKLNELFDDILDSSVLGVLKDELEEEVNLPFFATYLADQNVGYDEVVLLDDSKEKFGNYQQQGFNRILINSRFMLQEVMQKIADKGSYK